VLALQRLTRFLAARDKSIDLIVIDIESMTTQEMKQCFGREFHGGGETQWIRDGKVIASLDAYPPETDALILSYFKRLLEERAP
jgi:hypothetical protein